MPQFNQFQYAHFDQTRACRHRAATRHFTASDCEGAGEMFRVTTLKDSLKENPEKDFFGKQTYLTVSGQLEGEAFACALSNICTFGPTFRAENSNTARHAAEFLRKGRLWPVVPRRPAASIAPGTHSRRHFINWPAPP